MAEKSSELENTSESSAISTSSDESTELVTRGINEDEADLDALPDFEASSEDDDTDEGATDDTEQIRTQIEETRAQMGETIDAIQEKLSFSNISDQVSEQINSAVETAKDAVYDATIGKAGTFMKNLGGELSKTTVVQTARDNPFPFLLIGLGVGLLAYNGFGSGKRGSSARSRNFASAARSNQGQGGKSTFSAAQEKIGGVASSVTGAASTAASSVSSAASTAASTVSGAASTAYGSVTNAAGSAYEGVSNFAGTAKEKVGDISTQAREQYDYYIEENPLAVGAVALALGAAVGFSIPSTSYEGQLMGEARHNLMEKAQETAGTLVDKVKQVASEAQKTIGDEAKASGLLGDAGSTGGGSGSTGGSSTGGKTGGSAAGAGSGGTGFSSGVGSGSGSGSSFGSGSGSGKGSGSSSGTGSTGSSSPGLTPKNS